MEGFITTIVAVLIISFISSIIKGAKKNLQNSNDHTDKPDNQPQSLQSLIREQVNMHKDSLLEQFNTMTSFEEKPQEKLQEKPRYQEGDRLNRETLEGTPVEHQRYSHDTHRNRYNEGDKLNRDTLEGITLEGGMYDDDDGMSLDALDLDDADVLKATKSRKTKATKPKKYVGASYRGLKFNRENIVNGVIMSEVLAKRGGRR